MKDDYFSNFLKRFYKLTRKVRLIWALCAVILIMFGLDFSPIMSSNVAERSSEFYQGLTAVPGSNLLAQSTPENLNQANAVSTQLAQAKAAPQGQVKAVTAVSIAASKFGSVAFETFFNGYCWCYVSDYYPKGPPPLTGGGGYSPPAHTWVTFPLSALPAGQQVLSAKLRNYSYICPSWSYITMIGPYTNYSFYYSPEGTLDPSLDSYQKQFERSGGFARWSSGSDGRGNWGGYRYPDGTCPGFASHDLGWIAASDIYLAKPLVNRFSLGINATSCPTCGPITLGTNFWLDLTYGVPSVDLKVNGSGGPVSVAGGSNITLTWDSVGYDKCYYGSSPAWYTPAWPTGKQSATTGSATTKIYYENVTYMINCKNSGSGTSATAQVTVNVTP